ncbi:MAG: hypothetical protein JRH20_05410 [Deltaproteobacteria bacterium]|nr:hypothetical protein [Deltaproteobacteria bacterium]
MTLASTKGGQARRRGGGARRTLLLLYFCVGVTGLLLLTAGEPKQAVARQDPMAGYFLADMPRYPETRLVPSGTTRVGGADLKMAYFNTKDDPHKVADYYLGFWKQRGFWTRREVTHRGGVVAAVDNKEMLVYQLLLFSDGRQTTAFPSLSRGPDRIGEASKEPPVKLYPDSRVLLNTTSKVAGTHAHMVLSVNGGSIGENRAHYDLVLAEAGFREARREARAQLPKAMGKQVMLYHDAQGRELTLAFSQLKDQQTRVHLTMVQR